MFKALCHLPFWSAQLSVASSFLGRHTFGEGAPWRSEHLSGPTTFWASVQNVWGGGGLRRDRGCRGSTGALKRFIRGREECVCLYTQNFNHFELLMRPVFACCTFKETVRAFPTQPL